jgi:adenylate cyclase
MAVPRAERRLAAVLAADVVGYSRLMERDEQGTLERLKTHRRKLVEPLVAEHRGRIVKLMGDGALCEFPSVVDAVACAVAIQRGMAEREKDVPEAERIRFRIGINLGDVIVEGGDIYGDGVNVAARLEQLAEPGGIRISDAVRQHVDGKLEVHFEDLGLQRVKNIERPVRVSRIVAGGASAGKSRALAHRGRVVVLLGLVILGAGAAFGVWRVRLADPGVEAVPAARMAYPLPEEPSIAVLPFGAPSGVEEERALGTGLAAALGADLGWSPGLFVIAQEAAWRAGEEGLRPREIAERFGIRFVLRGSLEASDPRSRDVALEADMQLVDAIAGRSVWQKKYPLAGGYHDALSRLAEDVSGSLSPDGAHGQVTRACSAGQSPPPEADRSFVQGLAATHRHTPEANQAAERLLREASQAEPGFASAHAWRSRNAAVAGLMGWSGVGEGLLERARASALAAIALDPACPVAHWSIGVASMLTGDHRRALDELEKASKPNPTHPDLLAVRTKVLAYLGRRDEGLKAGRRALRRNPDPPSWYYWHIGIAEYLSGRSREAIATFNRVDRLSLEARLYFVASYIDAGRGDEAHLKAVEILKQNPRFSINEHLSEFSSLNKQEIEKLTSALVSANLPLNVRWECLVRNICP